jgi:Reverse transcriptase (RNA-dependent DNA polymerase)
MVVCFVDDLGVSGKTQEMIDDFVSKLCSKAFELDIEGSFKQYLGINFDRNRRNETIELTQKGLITKIIATVGLEGCKPNSTPASQLPLSKDEGGNSMS